MGETVEVRNVNHPGKTQRLDARKFALICEGLLKSLPTEKPGLSQGQWMCVLREQVSEVDFPGSTHGWWGKSAQLHLEAEGRVIRDPTKPLTWRRV